MPRAFSVDEHRRIREQLVQAAILRFGHDGLARTTVADLAGDAGISKGAFYLFFPHKEALLFAGHEVVENEVRGRILAALAPWERARDGIGALRTFLHGQARELQDQPLLRRLADPDVMAALLRVMPAEVIAEHRASDLAWRAHLQRGWVESGLLADDAPPELLFALSAGILSLLLTKAVSDPYTTLVLDTWCDGAALRWGRRP